MSGIEKYIRTELNSFGAYSATKSPEEVDSKIPVDKIIKMDQNENPYGCSPQVAKALGEYSKYHIYPDATQSQVRKQLASYTGVNEDCIVVSSGSNTLLDMITRLFVNPGDGVINFVPTFDIYRFSAQICGAKLIELERNDKYELDLTELKTRIDKNTRLIFLANPNAPTGNPASERDIISLLDKGLPTVIDEAYYEFSGITMVPLMRQYQNLMIVRTFSKWSGLAGLRVGYGLFPKQIAEYLHRIKIPYNVNVAALIAVTESLNDLDYLKSNVSKIIIERERLIDELKKIEWLKPYPSQANFILCRIINNNAQMVYEKLEERGILVRYFKKPGLENCIRISIGKPEDTDAVIIALHEIGQYIK